MRNNGKTKNPLPAAGRFLKKAARRPLAAFLLLAAIGAAAAAAALFAYQSPDFAASLPVSGSSAKNSFGAAEAGKYREVFKTRQAREQEYLEAGAKEYPDIFQKPLPETPPSEDETVPGKND